MIINGIYKAFELRKNIYAHLVKMLLIDFSWLISKEFGSEYKMHTNQSSANREKQCTGWSITLVQIFNLIGEHVPEEFGSEYKCRWT